jgi:transposase
MDVQQENERLKQENRELQAALRSAEEKIAELTAMLKQNSRNSHWPSSRDTSRQKKRTYSQRQKSAKKPGGQSGHRGTTLKQSEKVDTVRVHRPTQCGHCQAPLGAEQPVEGWEKRQVHDLPPLRLLVTEHQAATLRCGQCGQLSRGVFPPEVRQPVQYGARVQQLVVYLKTAQLLPYERSRQCFADLFGVSISPGTLQNIIRRAARQLQPVVVRIQAALQSSAVVHFDESGFYIGGQRQWLHTAGTPRLTYYYPHARRGHTATDAMGILPHFQGTAVHDSWSAYRHYQHCAHSLCNAHHLRELTAVVENDAQSWAAHFKRLLRGAKHVVDQARQAGLATLPPPKVAQIERLYAQLIQAGLEANPPPADGWPKGKRGRPKKPKARNLVERLQQHRTEVLAFVYDFKVPFDNNLAERDIRMLKVQQKISGCFRSHTGAQDFCTIRSYISTMRKQGRSVWAALGSLFSPQLLFPDFSPV